MLQRFHPSILDIKRDAQPNKVEQSFLIFNFTIQHFISYDRDNS